MKTVLAAEIGRVRDTVADTVTEQFLARHPDWIERYGDRATTHGVQGARHHIDFLRAAVELDDPKTFRDYAVWCRDVLDARGIAVEFLVENFEDIRDELTQLLSPLAVDAVDAIMRVGLDALAGEHDPPRSEADSLPPACRLYVAASVSGRREAAMAIVREAVRGGATPIDVYIDIFQEALYEVGHRWQDTGLTVAEEHMATATTQFILSVLQEESPRARGNQGVAVVTGVVGERHVVGASIVANVLDAEGWDVRFLGSDMPHDAIVAAIDQYQADLVAVSVTLSKHVPHARDLITRIRGESVAAPRIIVGGAAFRGDPQRWRAVGADGFADDARSVGEVARG